VIIEKCLQFIVFVFISFLLSFR